MSPVDDGQPSRAERLEAAARVKQAHDAEVRCSWSCGPTDCDGLEWALRVLAESKPDPGRAR